MIPTGRHQGNSFDFETSASAVQNDFSSEEALNPSTIAELSSQTLGRMTCEELVRVITAADLPRWMKAERPWQIPSGDRDALLRLAHLARRCCRNQGY